MKCVPLLSFSVDGCFVSHICQDTCISNTFHIFRSLDSPLPGFVCKKTLMNLQFYNKKQKKDIDTKHSNDICRSLSKVWSDPRKLSTRCSQ